MEQGGILTNEPLWDFQTALGDTIKEKYESLYVKIVEVTDVINRKLIPRAYPGPVPRQLLFDFMYLEEPVNWLKEGF